MNLKVERDDSDLSVDNQSASTTSDITSSTLDSIKVDCCNQLSYFNLERKLTEMEGKQGNAGS